MEERYEIRGKIGQGGVGAVYRAYDTVLSREVAIKRILPDEDVDPNSDAAKQLTKEAGALSALQHPHIVTIYDVGTDKDGSFVVMELLQGKTVDTVVEKAVFTWPDFREFAMQTQEALIAAQDLNLVHRDLKPSNIMLTWLPSGKFQVKIVDFGLAKFTPKPSLQTIDQKDSIFGSIFFMAPEQFERVELDGRTDLYAMGCVYYYALTGMHPFDGETGPQVMVAHLDHRVYPLHEIRPDIPRWVSDWIMWHINRLPEHRPAKARDSLALFVQNDHLGDQGAVAEVPPPSRGKPRLLTPGALVAAQPERPSPPLTSLLKTAPQPITPPDHFGHPSIHTSSQVTIKSNDEFSPAPNAPAPAEVTVPPVTDAPAEPVPVALAVPAPAEAVPVVAKAKPRLVIPGGNSPTPTAPAATAVPAVTAVPVATAVPLTAVPVATPAVVPVAVPASPPQASSPPAPPVVATPVSSSAAAPPPPPVLAAQKPTLMVAKPATPVAANPVATARAIPTSSVPSKLPQTAPLAAAATGPAIKPATAPPRPAPGAQLSTSAPAKKKGMNNGAKAAIATTLGILVIAIAGLMLSRGAEGKKNKRYNELVALAAMANTKDLPVSNDDLDILLNAATTIAASSSRETVYKALFIAESADGTNIDEKLVGFTTTATMNEEVRANLLRRVIGGRIAAGRQDDKTATALIGFIKSNPKPESAAAAIEALKGMAKDEHFAELLNLLQFSGDSGIRKRCEEVVVIIVKQSGNRGALDEQVEPAFNSATSPEVKQSLLRVLGATGTPKAKEVLLSQLKSSDKTMQIAAADASKNWPDESLFENLLQSLDGIQDNMLRARVFHSCRESLLTESKRSAEKTEELWKALAAVAKVDSEQEAVIRSIVGRSEINTLPWAHAIIRNFEKTSESDSVVDLAGKALDRLKARSDDDK